MPTLCHLRAIGRKQHARKERPSRELWKKAPKNSDDDDNSGCHDHGRFVGLELPSVFVTIPNWSVLVNLFGAQLAAIFYS